ncbi:MAG: hypothetical protein QM774_10320 [Gordonia sp. (in: high G+C Gram-positive bacteria)]
MKSASDRGRFRQVCTASHSRAAPSTILMIPDTTCGPPSSVFGTAPAEMNMNTPVTTMVPSRHPRTKNPAFTRPPEPSIKRMTAMIIEGLIAIAAAIGRSEPSVCHTGAP